MMVALFYVWFLFLWMRPVKCHTCVTGRKNLAFQKPASQSSTLMTNRRGIPSAAVDGVSNGDFNGCRSCTHTAEDAGPWWMVDLGETFTIQEVAITNRARASQRLHNFTIEIAETKTGNDLHNPVLCWSQEASPVAGVTISYPCISGDTPGRFVKIALLDPGFLSLCEVFVYGPYSDPKPEPKDVVCQEQYAMYRFGKRPDLAPLRLEHLASFTACSILCLNTENCRSFAISEFTYGIYTCELYDCKVYRLQASPGSKYFVEKSVASET